MYQGQQPFRDFFEHHSPPLWLLLKTYYQLWGANYGIITASRALMILVFALTTFLAYRIARNWASPQGSWIAALGFPLFSFGLLLAHLFVRGDPIILLLLMTALWISIPLADNDIQEKSDLLRLFAVFLCLGIAVSISPRAGIPSLTLFLTLAFFALRSLPLRRVFFLFLAGGIIVILPTAWLAWRYDPELYLFWVYHFSATLYPAFSPLPRLLKLLITAAPIWILAVVAFYRLAAEKEFRGRRSIWLVATLAVVNLLGLWATTRPFMQHFLMTVPFWGLLAAAGYDKLLHWGRSRMRLPDWNWAGILLILGVLLIYGKTYQLWKSGALENRAYWVQRARWLVENAGQGASFAAGMAYFQPIFVQDAFYYWFAGRYATATLGRIQPNFKPYGLRDLQERQPTIVHESIAVAWNFEGSPQFRSWLQANYVPTGYRQYWLRKRSADP